MPQNGAHEQPNASKPARAGRKTKLTAERQEKIVGALLAGCYFETACRSAGVAPQTACEWLARGENRDPDRRGSALFAEFAEAVRGAEAQAEVHAVAIIRQGFPDNPRLALDFLARRFPERWGERQTVTLLQRLAAEAQAMSDDELLAVLEAGDAEDDAEATAAAFVGGPGWNKGS